MKLWIERDKEPTDGSGTNSNGPDHRWRDHTRHVFGVVRRTAVMRIEFDRDTCIGMFQCVAEWDGFERDETAGKAILVDGEETDDDTFVCEIPESEEIDAKFAARVCPVDAITVYDDDGEQLIP